VKLADRAPSFPRHRSVDETETTIKPVKQVRPTDGDWTDSLPLHLPQVVGTTLRVVFYTCIVVVPALFLVYAWRNRPRLRRQVGRRQRSAQWDVLDDAAAVIGADADAQRAALERGSPRNAIVECWLRLEQAVVAAGVRHDPANTSTEFTVCVLTTLQVDQVAVERLAALYREARFSDHPMGEGARRAAIDALDDIHDGLRAGRGAVVAPA
jgi:hypothetical protein